MSIYIHLDNSIQLDVSPKFISKWVLPSPGRPTCILRLSNHNCLLEVRKPNLEKAAMQVSRWRRPASTVPAHVETFRDRVEVIEGVNPPSITVLG